MIPSTTGRSSARACRGHCGLSRICPPLRGDPETQVDFVGRHIDLYRLVNLVSDHPLVTVTGLGGIGKTSLAWEALRWLRERRRFAAFAFVPLAGRATVAEIRLAIALALGLPPERAAGDRELATALAGQRLLLVLDDLDEAVAQHRREVQQFLGHLVAYTRDGLERPYFLVTTRTRPGADTPDQVLELHRLEPLGPAAAGLFFRRARDRGAGWAEAELALLAELLAGHAAGKLASAEFTALLPLQAPQVVRALRLMALRFGWFE
ncbi:MAG: ATP-binding protein [Chloroflexi bacterium]|nr:ATP-binding protein [Chloroflexota bacterium]